MFAERLKMNESVLMGKVPEKEIPGFIYFRKRHFSNSILETVPFTLWATCQRHASFPAIEAIPMSVRSYNISPGEFDSL